MRIRPFAPEDLDTLVDLTIETFRPYFEGFLDGLLGGDLARLHHGRWQQDYRDDLPTLHDPAAGRHIAVADAGPDSGSGAGAAAGGAIAGYVSWKIDERPGRGQIYLLAVAERHRGRRVARDLCAHAIEWMKAAGVGFVEIGTGDDPFHAPARARSTRRSGSPRSPARSTSS